MKFLPGFVLLGGLLAAGALLPPTLQAQSRAVELDYIVAVVNEDIITRSELVRQVRMIAQRLRQQNAAPPPEAVLTRQVLERMIVDRAQLQQAERAGIRVDDEAVNRVLGNIARENGLTLPQFREVLERDGYNFAEFRQDIRNEMIVTQLQKRQVDDRVTVTEQEVDHLLANMTNQQGLHDEYRLAHILIALPEGATSEVIQTAEAKAQQVLTELRAGADFHQMAIAVSDGQQALQGGDLGWRKGGQLPVLFADRVRDMRPGEISPVLRSPSGFHLIKLVEKRGEQQHLVQQTLARHILVQTSQVVNDEEARMRLTQLRARILAGEDFGQLARAHSEDKGSARDGGSLGWVDPGQLVPQFEEVMNNTAPGQISEPFRSPFGWHIVQVMSRRTQDDTQKFQRARARELIHQRKADEALQNWLRQLRDEAYVEYRLNE